jgi:hypothetical protein
MDQPSTATRPRLSAEIKALAWLAMAVMLSGGRKGRRLADPGAVGHDHRVFSGQACDEGRRPVVHGPTEAHDHTIGLPAPIFRQVTAPAAVRAISPRRGQDGATVLAPVAARAAAGVLALLLASSSAAPVKASTDRTGR